MSQGINFREISLKHLIAVAEGVEPTVLRREMDAGRLPWFSKIAQEGRWWDMDCGPVPYEPTNLASAFSGQGPGEHGCFSYWAIRDGGNKPRVLETPDVKVKRFWEWPELQDVRVSVINVQLTHPPQPLNGNLITYPMLATLRACYPNDLLGRLSRNGVRYAHDVTVFYKGQDLDSFAAEAQRAANYQLDTALALADDCDVMVFNFTLPDRLSHFLWHELEQPEHEWTRRPHILQAYDFVDQACARLSEKVTGSTMVFSEIGFGGIDGFVSIDKLLQNVGLQYLDEDGGVDLQRSLAFEAVQGSHGIILAQGMRNGGSIARNPGDFDVVREALLGFKFEDGTPVLAAANHRDDVYTGPWRHLGPDIIIKPTDPRRPPLGDPRWADHVLRNDQSGWHRDQGFVMVSGPTASRFLNVEKVSLESIAPTIARLMGRDVPSVCAAPSLVV